MRALSTVLFKKTRGRHFLALGAVAIALAGQASMAHADVLYDNNGGIYLIGGSSLTGAPNRAWDSFALSADSTLTGFTFDTLNFDLDTGKPSVTGITKITWSLTFTATGSPFAGGLADVTPTLLDDDNGLLSSVWRNEFSLISDLGLGAGEYWLHLGNAQGGGLAGWNIHPSSTSSEGFDDFFGDVDIPCSNVVEQQLECSHSFSVLGKLGIDHVEPPQDGVPEPATWSILLIGFFGAGAMLRNRSGARRPA